MKPEASAETRMKELLRFGAGSLALIAVTLAATWPFLQSGAWVWLAAAGGVAFVAQFGLHIALASWRKDPKKFMRAVVTGTAVRFSLVIVGLVWAAVGEPPHPVAFLLGLAGFLFGMLLIESGLEQTNRFRPGFAAGDPAVRG